jgi:hypothetical protein
MNFRFRLVVGKYFFQFFEKKHQKDVQTILSQIPAQELQM